MRVRSFLGVIGTLLAVGISTNAHAASPDWPTSLTLGTASPGGVYYPYGEAIAQILTEKLGITVNPLPTQGPVHNVKLVDTGAAQLGIEFESGPAQVKVAKGRIVEMESPRAGKRFRVTVARDGLAPAAVPSDGWIELA